MLRGVERMPRVDADRRIGVLEYPLIGRESLSGLDWREAAVDGAGVPMPRRDIPAPRPAVVAVRRRAEPQVRPTGPIRRVAAVKEHCAARGPAHAEPGATHPDPRPRSERKCSRCAQPMLLLTR